MYEFHRVGESTCYLSAPTNIGIYLRGKGAYLIDAGSRDADADQILRVLGENGLTLAGVISTHPHADHTGGNRRLQDVTSAGRGQRRAGWSSRKAKAGYGICTRPYIRYSRNFFPIF